MKSITLLSITALLLFACSPEKNKEAKPVIKKDSVSVNEYLQMSVLYHQRSAELKALSYQAFNLAKMTLDTKLKDKTIKKKKAVIVDIDETIIDNSPFEAKCILEGTHYPKYWNEWVNKANTKAMPGAVEFLSYASTKGVEVFYITNRNKEIENVTLQNLKKDGFPYADTMHLLLKTEKDNSKESRRQKVASTYEVLLLMGDNLADFSSLYDHQTSERRLFVTDSLKNVFGSRFIILPNAMYGDWEDALYGFNYNLSSEEKEKIRQKNLISF
jgi:5'-nucleotidase (lipoprotein e(P4) family)